MNFSKNKKKVFATALSFGMLVLGIRTTGSAEAREYYDGAMYDLMDESFDWNQAKEECRLKGGHLVIINDQEEENFIESLIQNGEKKAYWIGFTNSDGSWNWVDGTPLTYTNWEEGQPDNLHDNESCGMIYNYTEQYDGWSVHDGKWNDLYYKGDLEPVAGALNLNDIGYICEIPWDRMPDDPNRPKSDNPK